MSKNKHGDLFNTSLTEIIIILFFVLMLFALFNIDKVNQENVGLGDEIDSLISDKVILEENNQTLEEIVNVKDDPASLAPINVELAQQISDLKKENRELEKEIERLSPADLIDVPPEPLIEPDEESLIAGNCIDKKFWRQCAEWAWPLASTPPYEYLFDIGMCSSGSIVVIESAWNEKKEMDFILVNGASTITDNMYIKRNEIKSFISLVHDKSLDFREGQTQHAARLINLENVDTDVSNDPRLNIQDHMKFDPYRRGTKKYEEIKKRFPENACDTFKVTKKVEPEVTQKPIKDSPKINMKPLPEGISSSLSKASFIWDGNIVCKRAARKRGSAFNATFNLLITTKGRVKVQGYSYDKTNKNNRLVVIDAKEGMEKQRNNINPVMDTLDPKVNKIEYKYKFPKDICR